MQAYRECPHAPQIGESSGRSTRFGGIIRGSSWDKLIRHSPIRCGVNGLRAAQQLIDPLAEVGEPKPCGGHLQGDRHTEAGAAALIAALPDRGDYSRGRACTSSLDGDWFGAEAPARGFWRSAGDAPIQLRCPT